MPDCSPTTAVSRRSPAGANRRGGIAPRTETRERRRADSDRIVGSPRLNAGADLSQPLRPAEPLVLNVAARVRCTWGQRCGQHGYDPRSGWKPRWDHAREGVGLLGRGWEAGTATIIARKPLSAGSHGITTRWSYVADVRPDSGAPAFRATFDDPHLGGELISPQEGAVVRVKCRPASKDVKLDRSDPSLSRRRQRAQQRDHVDDRFERLAGADPGETDG